MMKRYTTPEAEAITTVNLHVQQPQLHTPFALLQALGLVLIIMLAEYSARRFVAPWLPTIGAPRVNDMLASAVCYTLLVVLTAPSEKRHVVVFWQVLGEIVSQMRKPSTWAWAILLIVTSILSVVDQALWGRISLPGWYAPLSSLLLLRGAGPLLQVSSLLLVNGVMVPLAEERLWRGLIQPRLVAWLGLPFGLVLTALLFSLKHVIIDASLGRFLTLFAFGLVVGFVASRSSWKRSACIHSMANIVATILALIVTGGNI